MTSKGWGRRLELQRNGLGMAGCEWGFLTRAPKCGGQCVYILAKETGHVLGRIWGRHAVVGVDE